MYYKNYACYFEWSKNCPRDKEINAATIKLKWIEKHQRHQQIRSHFSAKEKKLRCVFLHWDSMIPIYVKLMRCVKVPCLEFEMGKNAHKMNFKAEKKTHDEHKNVDELLFPLVPIPNLHTTEICFGTHIHLLLHHRISFMFFRATRKSFKSEQKSFIRMWLWVDFNVPTAKQQWNADIFLAWKIRKSINSKWTTKRIHRTIE